MKRFHSQSLSDETSGSKIGRPIGGSGPTALTALLLLASCARNAATLEEQILAKGVELDPTRSEYREPQSLDPQGDQNYLYPRLGIHSTPVGNKDGRFNVLIIGQDIRPQASFFTKRADGSDVEALLSRADSIAVASFKRDRPSKVTIFGFPRDLVADEGCWEEVEAERRTQRRILAELYLMGQRRIFVPCIQRMLGRRIRASGMENEFELQGGETQEPYLRVNGIVEANFSSFKSVLTQSFQSLAGLADIYSGMTGQFLKITQDEVFGDGVLSALRERKDYDSTGGAYQRAWNHLRFLSELLGYLGYGSARNEERFFGAIATPFAQLSRSFIFETVVRQWRERDDSSDTTYSDNRHIFSVAGYQQGESPVELILWGPGTLQNRIHPQAPGGQPTIDTGAEGASYFSAVNATIDILPKPADCGEPCAPVL